MPIHLFTSYIIVCISSHSQRRYIVILSSIVLYTCMSSGGSYYTSSDTSAIPFIHIDPRLLHQRLPFVQVNRVVLLFLPHFYCRKDFMGLKVGRFSGRCIVANDH
ncbi:hypothetical protein GDO81_020310 [Engystomops pustulosus]|uniref:Uncharacterized protein n=1 Tax=Engystomops pustulosus TaxID=76066 RepID=A0AAV6Z8B5_ENGPU|nr:hypothetical protein GDO81_020310 [Engystomops pustulosus]